jgi:hypothetical protein
MKRRESIGVERIACAGLGEFAAVILSFFTQNVLGTKWVKIVS